MTTEAERAGLTLNELSDLFEHAPCGYIIMFPDGQILRANETVAGWVHAEASLLVGRRFQELLNIAGKIYYETHFAPLLRIQGHFNEVALDLVAGAKPLPVLINAVEQRDEAGKTTTIRLTIFNAQDRRRYETELLAARTQADRANVALQELNAQLEARIAETVADRMQTEEKLRQSQKMEAIGQLTGGVAHDFNNLLTVIMGGLETIRRHLDRVPAGEPRDKITRARDMASLGAQRAANLTARLLAFSRRQPLDPQPLDITKLLRELSELLRRTLGETIDFESVEHGGLWAALVDPTELSNALVNLSVNARDAMPNGGRLTVETSNIYLDENYLAAVDEPVPPGQYVLVAVSDTGTGMEKATLTKVFEPFFTTKEPGKGTGLGLSQVYGFVRQSGGHVRIYSEVGHGTVVKLYLPRAAASAKPVRDEAGPTLPMRGSETILICEDEPELRAFGAEALRELGYAVIEARDAREAIEKLRESPHVDLLFTDVVLPNGMDGRRLADAAIEIISSIKIIFTSGYTRNAIVHNGKLDAGVVLLTKPFTIDALAQKVRAVLDSRSPR